MRAVHVVAVMFTIFAFGLVGLGCSGSTSNPYGSSPTSPAPASAPPNTVLMTGMTFSPTTITVAVGTTVTWKNADGIAHTSTSDTGVWDTGNMAAGASTVTTFKTAGTYPYHCLYHAAMGMKGSVIVK
jgi:plastocyanin